MRKIIVIGGSKGIGSAIVKTLIHHNYKVISISRTIASFEHENYTQFSCDVLANELPEIDEIDGLIYCPGSINLKPIARLKLDDFRQDFEINVIGVVKVIQKYLPVLKNGNHPSILLFSTVYQFQH